MKLKAEEEIKTKLQLEERNARSSLRSPNQTIRYEKSLLWLALGGEEAKRGMVLLFKRKSVKKILITLGVMYLLIHITGF